MKIIHRAPLFLLLLLLLSREGAPYTYSISSGMGSDGVRVGVLTSSVNDAVARLPFPKAAVPNVGTTRVTLVNSSSLSYLTLSGTFIADEPLQLLPLFVLRLARGFSLTPAANFSGAALIIANGTRYSSVLAEVGGWEQPLLSCPAAGASPMGVLALNSDFFIARGMSIVGCGGDTDAGACVAVESGSNAEVSGLSISSCEARAVWGLATKRLYVRGCSVARAYAHTLDVDALCVRVRQRHLLPISPRDPCARCLWTPPAPPCPSSPLPSQRRLARASLRAPPSSRSRRAQCL